MNLNRITAGRKKEGGYVRTYIPRHLVSPSGHSSFGLSCTHNAFLPRSEEEKNRLRFLRSPLCFLSLRVPPLPPTSWSVHAQFGIGMSAILILGIGRIPSLPSPFYTAARGPANEKVVPPWRCRNGTTCLDATAVSGIAEEEAVLYWVHAFLPLCSTILHYSEEETLSLFPTHLAFYWFPPRCHLIGCQDNKEGRGEDKTEEVTLLEGREEEETCFSLSLSLSLNPTSFFPPPVSVLSTSSSFLK